MHYQIIVPLCSTDVLLEFDSTYSPIRPLDPSFYTYVTSGAFGPIKVSAHKIEEGDPMKLTLAKHKVSADEWDELIKENGLIITQLEAIIARLDTGIAQKSVALETCPRSSPDFMRTKSERDDLFSSKMNLWKRHQINSALVDLVRMSNQSHTNVHFEI